MQKSQANLPFFGLAVIAGWCACTMPNPAFNTAGDDDAAQAPGLQGGSMATAGAGGENTLRPVDASLPDSRLPPRDTAAPDTLVGPPRCTGRTDAILCLPFEGDAVDQSVHKQVTTLQGGTFTAGPDGKALAMTTAVSLRVAESTSFLVDKVTMQMWLNPRVLPAAGQRVGLLDREPDFGMFLLPDGRVQCKVNGVAALSLTALRTGTWSAIACTYDRIGISLFMDGLPDGGRGFTDPLTRAATEGMFVGSNAPTADERFDGQLDNVRVWSRALSAVELCASAINCRN